MLFSCIVRPGGLLEACCGGVVMVLCGDVCDVVCEVWEWCLIQCFAITKRSEIGRYDVPMYMSFFGFGIDMMSNFTKIILLHV